MLFLEIRYFFFSSRRRHTRVQGDWSSDVCSSDLKRGNRVCEQLLHDAEFLATARGDYPRDELDALWKLLLVQQFHDILPGSSIGLVYEDARRDFEELERRLHAVIGAGAVPV